MVFITSIFIASVLAPSEQQQHIRSAISAIFWVSNIFFSVSDTNYFAAPSDQNIFLHTWSLGVEEQFYLLWPVLLVGIFRHAKKNNRFTHVATLFFLWSSIFFFIFGLLITFLKPLYGFYMMPSRIWQFSLGALAFTLSEKLKNEVDTNTIQKTYVNRCCNPIDLLSIGIIIYASWTFNSESTYPGWRAALPSLSCAILLFNGSFTKKSYVGKFLSQPVFTSLGNISYSLYLWHWPILAIGFLLFPELNILERLLLIALAVFLSTISYFIIENPVRFNPYLKIRPYTVSAASFSLMCFGVIAGGYWNKKTIDWQSTPEQQLFINARNDAPIIYSMGCDDWYFGTEVKICAFGKPEAEHTVVMLGDSVLAQWFPLIRDIFEHEKWQVLMITKSSCPIIDEPYFYTRIGRIYTECKTWRDTALNAISELKPDYLFFGNTAVDFNQDQWIEGTNKILSKVSISADKIYIIQPTPRLGFDGPSCLARKYWINHLFKGLINCSSHLESRERNTDIYQWLLQASQAYTNVQVLDINNAICPNNFCDAEKGENIVYRDSMHVTSSFIKTLKDPFVKKLNMSTINL